MPHLYRHTALLRKLDSIADEILYNGFNFLDVTPHTWQARRIPT
jgi:hypothetical protein